MKVPFKPVLSILGFEQTKKSMLLLGAIVSPSCSSSFPMSTAVTAKSRRWALPGRLTLIAKKRLFSLATCRDPTGGLAGNYGKRTSPISTAQRYSHLPANRFWLGGVLTRVARW